MIKPALNFIISTNASLNVFLLALFKEAKSTTFIKSVGSSLLTKISVAVMAAVTTVLVARFLGPDGRGVYSVALTLGTTGAYLFLFGLNTSNTNAVAKDRGHLFQLTSNSLFFSLCISLLFCLVLIGLRLTGTNFPLIDNNDLLILLALWIIFNLTNILCQSLLIGIENIKAFNRIEITITWVGLLALVVSVLTKLISVEMFFLCSLLGQIGGLLLALFYLKINIKEIYAKISVKLLFEHIGYGFKALYIPTVFLLVLCSADLLMIKHFLGERYAGYYSIVNAMTTLLFIVPNITSMLLFAKLSSLSEQHKRWEYTARVIRWMALIITALLCFSYFICKPAVLFVFGEAFAPAIETFRIFTPAILFYSLSVIYLNYFALSGRTPINIYATAIAALLNILLNFKLIPTLGISGAALTANVSYGALLLILVLYNLVRKLNK